MCNWVTLLYSRKSTEHCTPAIMEKIKIIIKLKKKKERQMLGRGVEGSETWHFYPCHSDSFPPHHPSQPSWRLNIPCKGPAWGCFRILADLSKTYSLLCSGHPHWCPVNREFSQLARTKISESSLTPSSYPLDTLCLTGFQLGHQSFPIFGLELSPLVLLNFSPSDSDWNCTTDSSEPLIWRLQIMGLPASIIYWEPIHEISWLVDR